MNNDKLSARVIATNRVNKAANELFAKLLPILTPLVGQKITKADGTLTKKVQELLGNTTGSIEFPTPSLRICFDHSSTYSLRWSLSAHENYQHQVFPQHGIAMYTDQTVYIGNMENGVLTKVATTPPAYREDYTVQEIAAKRNAYEIAKKAADDALSALYPFGEDDR